MSTMRSWKTLVVLLSIAVVSFIFIVNVHASVSDQKTIVTFNQPVDIPGKVLTPGTYVFKLLDTAGSRDVVQVLDKNETKVITTFIALPTEMSKPPEKPFIRFKEQAPGAPPAIEAWFYPGNTIGHEFVYPRQHASELAKANNQNVASMPDNLAANTTQLSNSSTPPSPNNKDHKSVVEMKNATVARVTPQGSDVPVTKAVIVTLTPTAGESQMQTDNSHVGSH
jgi:hypothetical protein